jgi:arylsulfatase A-like enzyme
MRILVCQIPHFHLGYLGCYGNDWISTPALDRLAAEGVVFDQHYADCFSLETALQTGCYSFPRIGTESVTRPDARRLEEVLKDGKIPLLQIALPASIQFAEDLEVHLAEIQRQLQSLENVMVHVRFPSLAPPWDIPEEFLGAFSTDATDANDEEEDQEPFAPLFVPAAAIPGEKSDIYLERLRFTYAARVCQVDELLGSLVEFLREESLLETVLLIVTSDEGLSLGEHGEIGTSSSWLHEEKVHVPLIMRLPGGEQAGRRVFGLTQPVDLYPTVLEAFSLVAAGHHGHSLWPLLRGETVAVRDYAVAGRHDGGEQWVLRTAEWGLLLGRSAAEEEREVRLYTKPDDRWEISEVQPLYLDWTGKLEAVVLQFAQQTTGLTGFSPPPLPDMIPGEGENYPRGDPL